MSFDFVEAAGDILHKCGDPYIIIQGNRTGQAFCCRNVTSNGEDAWDNQKIMIDLLRGIADELEAEIP